MRKNNPGTKMALGMICALMLMPGLAVADGSTVKVVTQNLYIGSDIFQVVTDPSPLVVRAAKIFSDVKQTDFTQRAEVIAGLIAGKRPHLVGLQEVSLIRTQCPSDIATLPPIPPNPVPNATDVYADYLQILLAALAAKGAEYDVVAMIENVDAELPALNTPQILPGCVAPFFDARVTDFDVTLKRRDVSAVAVLEKNYAAVLPIPIPGGTTVFFKRGFTVVDGEIKGQAVRFVNTHLEVDGDPFSNFFQSVQANELVQTLDFLAALPGGNKPLVVAGDLNSSPDMFYSDCFNPGTGEVDPDGCLTPYGFMSVNGYTDLWTVRDDDEWKPGYTCCQAPLLDNRESELSRRIDHVWYRAPFTPGSESDQLVEANAKVLGTRKKKDRTVDGLWSSDHAGVMGILEFEDDDDD